MRVLVIGGGGREHALVWKLAQSPRVSKIYCAPGNPGINTIAECVNIKVTDSDGLIKLAREQMIDLTVVGPELPLAAGLVDDFTAQGLKIFGPTKAAARIESSKAFAKQLMKKYHIPTAAYEVFTDAEAAKQYIGRHGAPLVIKADGLAAGKGVVVAMTADEARAAIDKMMLANEFGGAGNRVVIEEFLSGEEASVLAFTDGRTVVPMLAAQDHKRIFDGDQGPNTGGMGAYAPAPVVSDPIRDQVVRDIIQPAVDALRNEGCPYRGCLYAGIIITAAGPKVIEFNARFGDPETQAVLPLLSGDLAEIMMDCIDGRLAAAKVTWREQAAVCVVLAAAGYPGSVRRGDVITGLGEAEGAGIQVFHAGTARRDGDLLTSGGRVLGVTAVAPDISQAVARAYQTAEKINFSGRQFRRDIAARARNR